MKQTASRSLMMTVVLLLFCCGLGLFYGQMAFVGNEWVKYPTNAHLYKEGSLTVAGTITDRNGEILATTKNGKRIFHEDEEVRKATAHAVGDLNGFVSTGVHSAFWQELTGYDLINGVYNGSGNGNDMELTIDAQLSVTAYRALGDRAGAVGVYNYQTGEILCMVSTPTFDPATETGTREEKGVYMNRLLSGSYAPGSIFKLVTALSVLENLRKPLEQEFSCNRGVTIDEEWLSCLGNHGSTDLEGAIVESCNAAFAQFGLELGRDTLTETAEQVGFNQSLTIQGVDCVSSVYDVEDSNDINFGWSSIGQYNDTVNPFQYLTFMGGIAGGGQCTWPYFVADIDGSGVPDDDSQEMMSEETAEELKCMMRQAVIEHYGDDDFAGLNLCAKTGTAEVGDKSTPHSWFVGFCDSEEKPYAFVVVVENAGFGLGAASGIASEVLLAAPSI